MQFPHSHFNINACPRIKYPRVKARRQQQMRPHSPRTWTCCSPWSSAPWCSRRCGRSPPSWPGPSSPSGCGPPPSGPAHAPPWATSRTTGGSWGTAGTCWCRWAGSRCTRWLAPSLCTPVHNYHSSYTSLPLLYVHLWIITIHLTSVYPFFMYTCGQLSLILHQSTPSLCTPVDNYHSSYISLPLLYVHLWIITIHLTSVYPFFMYTCGQLPFILHQSTPSLCTSVDSYHSSYTSLSLFYVHLWTVTIHLTSVSSFFMYTCQQLPLT